MAMRVPECEMCYSTYDLADHLPKILSCGHTHGLACLKSMYEREGRLKCPLCPQIDFEKPGNLQSNINYTEILDGLAIRCKTHEVTAGSFCPTCYVSVCAQCQHPCQVLNVAEEARQIHHILVDKMIVFSTYLQQANVQLPIMLKIGVRDRYSNTLRENFTLLWKLYEIIQSQNQLRCGNDQGHSNVTLYLYEQCIEVSCSKCNTPGGGELLSFPVPDEQSARNVLDQVMLELLKSINFCDLSSDFLQRYKERTAETPKTLLGLAQWLLTLKQPKKTVEQLPEQYCCPLCLQMLGRSTGVIRVLPCAKALHAICESCANGFRSPGVICPLENNPYKIQGMSLPRYPPSLSPPVLAPQPKSHNQLSCRNDQARSKLTLYVYERNIEVFCSQCNTPGGGELRSFPVPDEQSARDVLDQVMFELLKSTNFCDLTPDFLQRYKERTKETPKTLLGLAQGLLTLKQPKKTVEQLPEWYCCPLCLQILERLTGAIRVLPCAKTLHAICENCANGFGSQGATCPLDNNYYKIQGMSLPRHPPSLPLTVPVPQPIKPSNLYSYQVPVPLQTPSSVSSSSVPGTALPPFAPPANQFVLDRFISVLPLVEMPESQYTPNNRGWIINPNINQVEAMIFSCSETVKLRGLGISNPVKRDVQMTLQFVNIYAGGRASGATVFAETPNLALVGGNSIITYYTFRAPFSVTAYTKYTMKLKIAPPQGARDAIMVFRGNPFDRPDRWSGPDNSIWEFDEIRQAERGEEVIGQNNLTGPILQFIYSK